MKYFIITLILMNLFGCLEHAPIKTGFEGKPLPSFTFQSAESSATIKTDSLEVERPFAIFYFSPDCPYCRAQIKDITHHYEEIKNTKFILISNHSKEDVQKVINELKLNKYKNILIGIDNNSDYIKHYYISNVPYLAIYNRDKKLKQVLVGKTEFETIKRAMTERL